MFGNLGSEASVLLYQRPEIGDWLFFRRFGPYPKRNVLGAWGISSAFLFYKPKIHYENAGQYEDGEDSERSMYGVIGELLQRGFGTRVMTVSLKVKPETEAPEEFQVNRDKREQESGLSLSECLDLFLQKEQEALDVYLQQNEPRWFTRNFRRRLLLQAWDDRYQEVRSYASGDGISGSVFHCFADMWTGNVVRHAGFGKISDLIVGNVFDADYGAGRLVLGGSGVPDLPTPKLPTSSNSDEAPQTNPT